MDASREKLDDIESGKITTSTTMMPHIIIYTYLASGLVSG
jgi:hypothetical protein